ncbi:MAG TPA: hypothetical protein VMB49_07120 [Acidobacteriaceae bacterium]|nr:hypothetical protein [Acidobacteriaceae bacterium]
MEQYLTTESCPDVRCFGRIFLRPCARPNAGLPAPGKLFSLISLISLFSHKKNGIAGQLISLFSLSTHKKSEFTPDPGKAGCRPISTHVEKPEFYKDL